MDIEAEYTLKKCDTGHFLRGRTVLNARIGTATAVSKSVSGIIASTYLVCESAPALVAVLHSADCTKLPGSILLKK